MLPDRFHTKEEAFAYLIRKYAVPFSEACILEENDDIIYISDVETYEVYFLYGPHSEQMNPDWLHYQGKKCYQLLQGLDAPCPYCTNRELTRDQYYIWEHHNSVVCRDFLLKDKLADWEGRPSRIEIALDVTNAVRKNQILFDSVKQQNIVMHWLQILADSSVLLDAFDQILAGLCPYFHCEFGFIRAFTETELLRTYSAFGAESPLPFIRTVTPELLQSWGGLFSGNKQFIVRSVEALQEVDPDGYAILKDYPLHSFCITPVFSQERLIGLIGIGNFEKHYDTLFLIKILSTCLATAIQRRAVQEEKYYFQFKDPVTGYLNFESYKQEVNRILDQNQDAKYSLWYCDIKKFKFINDALGYDAGDAMLKYWAQVTAENTRVGETFCRISADNITMLRKYENIYELQLHFDRVLRSLRNFPLIAQKRFNVELVAGVYLIESERDRLEVNQMLNRANIAQKKIKALPGSHLAFYTDEMRQKEMEEIQLAGDLREALQQEAFLMYLQPQVDIQNHGTDEIRAEALVRWNRPGQNLMMPGEFIGLFERNGMIVDLDHYMFEHACRFLSRIRDRYVQKVCISVNVSRITMLQPDFADAYQNIKEKYQIPDGAIELEFTENGVVEDVAYFAQLVQKLQQGGFVCTMDDFGTGQSSLNILQRLPLNILKIDRSFFYGMQNGERNKIVVASILRMAKMLHMQTVAEGIELPEQVDALKQMECDYVQGFIFYRPLTLEAFQSLLTERKGSEEHGQQ